jgi:hypothetical protein
VSSATEVAEANAASKDWYSQTTIGMGSAWPMVVVITGTVDAASKDY